MIKAILFDLDNTLIDFMGLKRASCMAAIKAMTDAGLKIDDEKAYSLLFDLYKQYGIEHLKIFQKFLRKVNGKVDVRILAAAIVAYRKVQAKNRKTYPSVKPVLRKLKKNYSLGIVTDAPSMKAWIRLTEIGIVGYFDVIIAYERGKKKPDASPFRRAIRRLKVMPDEILFVGDQPHRDIKGAKALGMKTALAEYGIQENHKMHLKKNKPDFILKDFNDIVGVANKLKK
jgi:putative hydrolase of the HAD superfamily